LSWKRRIHYEEEDSDSLVRDYGHFSSQCRDTFSAAVISEFSDHHLQRHLQHDPTLLYQRVRLLVYHAAHRVLYKEAGRSRACWEIARGDGCVKFVIGKKETYEPEVFQESIAGGDADGRSERGNSFRAAVAKQSPGLCLRRGLRLDSPVQNRLHLRFSAGINQGLLLDAPHGSPTTS